MSVVSPIARGRRLIGLSIVTFDAQLGFFALFYLLEFDAHDSEPGNVKGVAQRFIVLMLHSAVSSSIPTAHISSPACFKAVTTSAPSMPFAWSLKRSTTCHGRVRRHHAASWLVFSRLGHPPKPVRRTIVRAGGMNADRQPCSHRFDPSISWHSFTNSRRAPMSVSFALRTTSCA